MVAGAREVEKPEIKGSTDEHDGADVVDAHDHKVLLLQLEEHNLSECLHEILSKKHTVLNKGHTIGVERSTTATILNKGALQQKLALHTYTNKSPGS